MFRPLILSEKLSKSITNVDTTRNTSRNEIRLVDNFRCIAKINHCIVSESCPTLKKHRFQDIQQAWHLLDWNTSGPKSLSQQPHRRLNCNTAPVSVATTEADGLSTPYVKGWSFHPKEIPKQVTETSPGTTSTFFAVAVKKNLMVRLSNDLI